MSISKFYREEVLQNVLNEYLLTGRIPTANHGEALYNEVRKGFPSLGERSLLYQTSEKIKPREEVPLEDLLEVIISGTLDAKVLRRTMIQSYTDLFDLKASWQGFYQKAMLDLQEVRNELERKLLLHEDAVGYLNSVTEDFYTVDHVSNDTNGLTHDQEEGLVIIADESSNLNMREIIRGSMIKLQAFVNGTRNSISSLAGTEIESILESANSDAWIGLVSQSSPVESVTLLIDIRLDHEVDIQKITFKQLDRVTQSGIVECFVSNDDRRNWSSVGQSSANNTIGFVYALEGVRDIRFILTKTRYDQHRPGTGYSYLFDCMSIGVFSQMPNSTKEEGMFQSTAYTLDDFNKVSLEVCDVTSDSTSIDYFVSVNELNWFPIQPLNKENTSIDKVVYFSNVNSYDNRTLSSGTVVESVGSRGIMNLISLAEHPNLNVSSNRVAILNYLIDPLDIPSIPLTTYRLFRGFKESFSIDSNDGWLFEDDKAITHFYVESTEGIQFDTGSISVNLDGVNRQGLISITAKGWHKIQIPISSYSITAPYATSLEELRSFDPLYPYNLKSLIEGYPYAATYTEVKVYNGFNMRAKKELILSDSFQGFLTGLETYFYIAKDSDGNSLFLVSNPDSASEFEEPYYLSYNKSENKFNELFVRAILKTRDPRISPILSEYTARMGY